MIRVKRLPCPAKLSDRQDVWTEAFLAKRRANPQARPLRRQYGHADVLASLSAMSHAKCFYCESKLSEDERTVDHYVEVAEAPERAFEWENLYLACSGCQAKLGEATVPRATCVDPCDETVDPADHLRFEDEIIRFQTDRGGQTIMKYKLDRDGLDLRRLRQLNRFWKLLDRLKDRAGGRRLSSNDLEKMRGFAAPDHAFSLMFRHLLSDCGLL